MYFLLQTPCLGWWLRDNTRSQAINSHVNSTSSNVNSISSHVSDLDNSVYCCLGSITIGHLPHYIKVCVSFQSHQRFCCIIIIFLGVITNDKSNVHAKFQGHRSKVKPSEVKTQLSHFWTLTPVWIHPWRWNEAKSLMQNRRGALLFFKVICQNSRSQRLKSQWIESNLRKITRPVEAIKSLRFALFNMIWLSLGIGWLMHSSKAFHWNWLTVKFLI